MTACLITLCHDGMHACSHSGATLIDIRRGSQQYDACLAQCTNALSGRQAKMKAHDTRLVPQQRAQHRIVLYETAVDLFQSRGRFCAKPLEVRSQVLEPPGLEPTVGFRWPVAEDI